jgi:hypothetical protein
MAGNSTGPGRVHAMATEVQGNESPPVRPKKPKKPISPARTIIGLVLLVGLSAVAYLEFSANRGFNQAVKTLNDALDKDDAGLLSDKDVEGLIGKAADGPAVKDAEGTKLSYTWSGVIKKHRFTAFYNNEKTPRLLRISTE